MAEIFDRTGYGEYESCPQHNGSYLDKEEPHHGEEEFDDKEEEEHKDGKDFTLYFLYNLVNLFILFDQANWLRMTKMTWSSSTTLEMNLRVHCEIFISIF